MPSNAITERQDERSARAMQGFDRLAPSVVVEDEPTVARWVGILGLALLLVAVVTFFSRLSLKREVLLGTTSASMAMVLGLTALLFHAAFERDIQYRRIYLFSGALTLVIGVFLSLLPHPSAMGDLFAPGFAFMMLGLLFLLTPLRHESDTQIRTIVLAVIGGAGVLMALVGLLGGTISNTFLVPYGLLLASLGLVYLAAFVGVKGTGDDLGYRAGWCIGVAGAVVFLVAALRAIYEPLGTWLRGSGSAVPADYLVNGGGLLLLVLGLFYVMVSLALCSDRPFVVMTRRELGAFFYSPIAYFVLFAFVLTAGVNFLPFVKTLLNAAQRQQGIPEPIVQIYLVSLWPVFSVIIGVPVLTMRLLSEEQRTGTLEVLLTAPVEETTVVLSKFVAALLMFMTILIPFGLLLLALRLVGGQPFDGRPLLAFLIGVMVTGAGFVALGLFFSALTRNQVAAAVLTFSALAALTALGIFKNQFFQSADGIAVAVLTHLSFLDVWWTTLEGKLNPSLLLFHASLAAVCLFLTVKWLEARKWR